jgi:hypothetical protein
MEIGIDRSCGPSQLADRRHSAGWGAAIVGVASASVRSVNAGCEGIAS